MEGCTQIHLQYLLSTVSALQKQNDALQKSLQEAKDKMKQLDESHVGLSPAAMVRLKEFCF